MDSGNLNHGHAICADDLSFAGLRSVHGRIDGYIMGDVGGSAMCRENHVSDAEALALFGGGTLVETVEEHCKAPSWLVVGVVTRTSAVWGGL